MFCHRNMIPPYSVTFLVDVLKLSTMYEFQDLRIWAIEFIDRLPPSEISAPVLLFRRHKPGCPDEGGTLADGTRIRN